jgi:hypothetical protein
MINLEISIPAAVALRQALYREQHGYTLDLFCCPTRIIDIRNLIAKLDTKIEEQLNEQEKV